MASVGKVIDDILAAISPEVSDNETGVRWQIHGVKPYLLIEVFDHSQHYSFACKYHDDDSTTPLRSLPKEERDETIRFLCVDHDWPKPMVGDALGITTQEVYAICSVPRRSS